MIQQDNTQTFTAEQLKTWGAKLLRDCKLPEEQIPVVLDALVINNLRGVDTHGIHLIRYYAKRFKTIPHTDIKIVAEGPGIAKLDGGANMGPVVGTFAMELAMKKAKQTGIGYVTASNSSHFAATGYYPMMAAQKGFVGYTCTCGSPSIAPWGGVKALASNTPFAISFPYSKFPIVLDMAVSTVAKQALRTYMREGWKLPDGWAMDKNGNPTNDAVEGYNGILMAIGGYKGVGIAMMTEILVGCINLRGFSTGGCINAITDRPQNTAHIFIAMDPDFIVDPKDREKELESFSERFHAIPRKQGVDKLYLPGELEWGIYEDRVANGIPVPVNVIKELNSYADEIGIEHLDK
jgi:LDH2 family malate/lactate/ureidoglycolate dehydrogenase